MTDNEKMIESINRRLSGMTIQQLRIMLTVAMKFNEVNEEKQEKEAEEATN